MEIAPLFLYSAQLGFWGFSGWVWSLRRFFFGGRRKFQRRSPIPRPSLATSVLCYQIVSPPCPNPPGGMATKDPRNWDRKKCTDPQKTHKNCAWKISNPWEKNKKSFGVSIIFRVQPLVFRLVHLLVFSWTPFGVTKRKFMRTIPLKLPHFISISRKSQPKNRCKFNHQGNPFFEI